MDKVIVYFDGDFVFSLSRNANSLKIICACAGNFTCLYDMHLVREKEAKILSRQSLKDLDSVYIYEFCEIESCTYIHVQVVCAHA